MIDGDQLEPVIWATNPRHWSLGRILHAIVLAVEAVDRVNNRCGLNINIMITITVLLCMLHLYRHN